MVPKNSLDNLVRNSDLTPSQRKARASKAGKASAKARRERKAMREIALDLLAMPVTKEMEDGLRQQSPLSMPKGRLTAEQGVVLVQLAKALAGDTRAVEFIRDTSGQKPAEKVEASVDVAKASEQLGDMLDEFADG